MTPKATILVVDDELLIRTMLSRFLTLRGYGVQVAHNGPEALALVEQEPPDLVILDMYMPGMNGLAVVHGLQARQYRGAVLALTASQDQSLLKTVREMGAVDVLSKPVKLEQLALAVQAGLDLSARER